jgi:hypothetical protein
MYIPTSNTCNACQHIQIHRQSVLVIYTKIFYNIFLAVDDWSVFFLERDLWKQNLKESLNWENLTSWFLIYLFPLIRNRVARFFLEQDTQTGNYVPNENKVYQMVIKNSKYSVNIPNGHKIYISTFSNLRPSKIYPNCYFWFETKASGNPDSKITEIQTFQLLNDFLNFLLTHWIIKYLYEKMKRISFDSCVFFSGKKVIFFICKEAKFMSRGANLIKRVDTRQNS